MDYVDGKVCDKQVIPRSNVGRTDTPEGEFTSVRQKDSSNNDTQDEPFCVRQQGIRNMDTQGESFCARQQGIRNIDTQGNSFCTGQQDIRNVDNQDEASCVRQQGVRNMDTQGESFCARQKDIRNIDTQGNSFCTGQQDIRNIDTQDEASCVRQQGIGNTGIQSDSSAMRQNDLIETEPQDQFASVGQQDSFSDGPSINVEESVETTDMIFRQKSPRQPLPRHRCPTGDVLSTDDGYEASMEELEAASDGENPRLSASPASADVTTHLKGGNLETAADSEFRYSLLEDVLMQKKLALLKSAEVKQFLQDQQSQVLAAVSHTSPKSVPAGNDSQIIDNG